MHRVAPLLLISLPCLLRAADGRIPIASLPYAITQPGRYYLTRDLSVASGNGITVNANAVEIDFAGHTLSAAAAVYPVTATGSSVNIHDGRIDGGNTGIQTFNSTAIPRTVVIERMVLVNQTDFGIYIGGNGAATWQAVLKDNLIVPTGTSCLNAVFLDYLAGGRIENNTIRGCRGGANSRGLRLSGGDNRIEGNHISYNSGPGMLVQGDSNLIAGNSVVASGGAGVNVIGNYNLIRANTGSANAFGSFSISGTDNVSTGDNCFNGPPATVHCN